MQRESQDDTRYESDYSSKVRDQVTEQTEKAKSKLSEVGRQAGERLNDQRNRAARAIGSGAATLHRRAEDLRGGPRVRQMVHTTADKLQTTADYLREHNVSAMMDDCRAFVRRYPAQSLAVGVLLGFVLGRALMRRSNYD